MFCNGTFLLLLHLFVLLLCLVLKRGTKLKRIIFAKHCDIEWQLVVLSFPSRCICDFSDSNSMSRSAFCIVKLFLNVVLARFGSESIAY